MILLCQNEGRHKVTFIKSIRYLDLTRKYLRKKVLFGVEVNNEDPIISRIQSFYTVHLFETLLLSEYLTVKRHTTYFSLWFSI